MSIEEFVSINQGWGETIKKVGGYYFIGQRDTVFPLPVYNAFPLNQNVKVDPGLTRALKRKFLITQVLLDLPKRDMYEFVLTTDNYNFEVFEGKIRYDIRKSLKIFSFQKPSIEDLLNEGLAINQQICERESITNERLTDSKKWAAHISSIYNDNGFTILGAYLEKRMIGYLTVYKLDDMFNLGEAYIDRNHVAGSSPMRGLLFVLINNLIQEHGTITISYGFHRYTRPTTLTRFKETMLFKRQSFAKGYVVNPLLFAGLKMMVFFMIKILKRRRFKRKWAEGCIRLYQGHRRLREAQNVDNSILSCRNSV